MIVAIVNNDTIEQTGELSVLFPNVSFPPNGPEAEWMAANNVMQVNYFKPHDRNTEKLVSAEPYLEDGSVYAMTVEPLTADEIAASNDSQWANVRADRNRRLAACDWTQLADAPVDASTWAVYRQELRDITTQADPFNVVWPTAPDAQTPIAK